MNSIIDSQREILLSVQGTNTWSGQQPQQYNSQAIAWGGLSHQLFSAGMRYQWVSWSYLVGLAAPVPFWLVHRYLPKLRADYYYIPIIWYELNFCMTDSAYVPSFSGYIGSLGAGINSSAPTYFAIAFISQWWIRTRYPRWFQKYNYLIGAGVFLVISEHGHSKAFW